MEASGVELAKPQKRILPYRDPELSHRVQFVPESSEPDEDFQIFVHKTTMEELRDFSATQLDREVGGVLVGGYFLDEEANDGQGQEFIVIDAYIRAEHGVSKHASFKFTHETWSHITNVMDEDFPESRIVGWHHTHPSFGIFLSGHDLFIQENFFNLPWQVALVVDPCRETMGFLRLREQGTRPIRSPFYLIRDR